MNASGKNSIIFLATGGLIGFAPIAPGTFGSLAALPLCWVLAHMDYPLTILILALMFIVSVWIADLAEKIFEENDPKQVVIDEICGMAIALSGIPFTPAYIIGGFLLFRIFDIKKPFPIRWVDRKIPGGVGIMMDDIIAGAITNILMQGAILLLA